MDDILTERVQAMERKLEFWKALSLELERHWQQLLPLSDVCTTFFRFFIRLDDICNSF